MSILRTYIRIVPLTLLLAAMGGTGLVFAQDGCTADPWDAETVYYRGDRVSNEYHEWKAKRASEGVEPGTHKPTWQDQGACDDSPPPPPAELVPLQIFGVWHAGNHYAERIGLHAA